MSQSDPVDPEAAESRFLVVARGHEELLERVRETVAQYDWIKVIEDRRRESVLLPREGRQGRPYSSEEL